MDRKIAIIGGGYSRYELLAAIQIVLAGHPRPGMDEPADHVIVVNDLEAVRREDRIGKAMQDIMIQNQVIIEPRDYQATACFKKDPEPWQLKHKRNKGRR